MEGSPWRRGEGQRRDRRDQREREVRLVMRGLDKRGEGRSTVIRRAGERLDSIEHGERELRDLGILSRKRKG